MIALALTACASDGPAAGLLANTTAIGITDAPAAAPSDTAAPDIATPATAAPEPEPVTTEAPAPAPTDAPVATTPIEGADDTDDTNWALVVLIIVSTIALVLALVALFTRSRRAPTPLAGTIRPTPSAQSPQVALLSTAQWVHDQLSLELMAAAPQQALARWANERTRLDNVAIGAQQQYASGAGEPWQSLSQMMSMLSTALDTNLNLRAQDQSNAQLVAESAAVVNGHRATLQQLLAAMWPLVQR